jgi:hypothetical protein
MKGHDHAIPNKDEPEPRHDEVAKKAYAIYLKEGRSQGLAGQDCSEADFAEKVPSGRCCAFGGHMEKAGSLTGGAR